VPQCPVLCANGCDTCISFDLKSYDIEIGQPLLPWKQLMVLDLLELDVQFCILFLHATMANSQ